MAIRQTAGNAAERAAGQPVLQWLERVGYVARGALYVVVGVLALKVATSSAGGQATDLTGALVFLIGNQFGKFVLIVMVVGLAAYAVWGLVRAIFDPLHRGSDASGLMARLGFVTSAVSYGAIAIFGLKLLMGTGSAATGDATQKTAASLLAHPFGGQLTILVGIIAIGIGIGQFVEAYRAKFKNDLKGAEMSLAEGRIVVGLGRYGMAARGVAFLVIGYFLIQAGIYKTASLAHGFGGAFVFLLNQPYGHLLLAIVALGFVALGIHSILCARWMRLMGTSHAASSRAIAA
jgi:uncharacterized protein DUF1206